MKKEDIPQDPSSLARHTKEVCYALDSSGNYVTGLSTGWDVKITALDAAWDDIQQRVESARKRVQDGEASPLLFFMELRLMDVGILASYTGFWKWTIKRHLKPAAFKKLPEKTLSLYADAFNVTTEELKTMNLNEK